LIEKEGVKEMALAFGRHSQALCLAEGKQTQGWSNNRRKIGQAMWLQMDMQIAQLLVSVPDRAGFKAASSLQSQYPFCCILFLIGSSRVLVCLFPCFLLLQQAPDWSVFHTVFLSSMIG
jgi:hypothetical protein